MVSQTLTGHERFFDPSELIVSKTDLRGRVTYANHVFCEVAGYSEDQLLGAPHSIIRHPHMPRAVFKLLWDTIEAGREIFAYVINRAANGDHYWVLAHVTPSYDSQGAPAGYHSSRRVPRREAVDTVIPVYAQLCEIEQSFGDDRKAGLAASLAAVGSVLKGAGMEYEEFVHSF